MASVLVNLRIPSLTLKPADGSEPKRIDNSAMRFLKTVELDGIPKAGETLTMTAAGISTPFTCTVKQVNWDDRENIFVVACSYGKSSIRQEDYHALAASQDWVARPLL